MPSPPPGYLMRRIATIPALGGFLHFAGRSRGPRRSRGRRGDCAAEAMAASEEIDIAPPESAAAPPADFSAAQLPYEFARLFMRSDFRRNY